MKIFKETIKYILKNFFVLLLFTMLPSIIFAIGGNIMDPISLPAQIENDSITIITLYRIFSALFAGNIWMGLIALIVVCLSFSILYGIMDKHMKIGKISLSNPFSRINETLLGVFPSYLILCLSFEIFALLNSAIIVLLDGLFVDLATIIIATIITIGLFFGYSCLQSMFLLVVPSQIVAGYSFKDAIVYSTRLTSRKVIGLALGFFVFILIAIALSYVKAILPEELTAISILIRLIVFNLIIMFYAVYPMVAYYELSNETRRDLEKKRKYIV